MLFKVYAQFDSIPVKSNLIYFFTRSKQKSNDKGETKQLYKKIDTVEMTLDTVIQLSGVERKLIVFSRCLNMFLLNETFPILKDSVFDDQMISNIMGVPYIDGDRDCSIDQISIVYQIKNVSYLLTAPKNFFKKYLRNSNFIKEIDKKLIKSAIDESSSIDIYNSFVYIYFNGLSMPLHKFVIFKGGMESLHHSFGENDYLFEFLRFEKTISSQDSSKLDEYVSYIKKMKIHDIIFSNYKGIVKSESLAWDKSKQVTYKNVFEFHKITR